MYLLLLVPNLGLMEHPHTVANRYTYLPACVLSAVLAFMLLRLRPGIRPAAWAACLVIGGALAQLATREARVWRNTRDYLESVLSASRIEEVRQITVSRLAFLQFLGGDVRGGRKIAYEELARAPGTGASCSCGSTWSRSSRCPPRWRPGRSRNGPHLRGPWRT